MKLIVMLAIASAAAACGRGPGEIDRFIGAACSDDRQCDERCYRGGDYPGGFCSISCSSDRDCPGDTFCIDKDGGVCMFDCNALRCSELGPGWECRDRKRTGGGNIAVCAGP